MVDDTGQSELSVNQILNNSYRQTDVKDDGGTNISIKNACVNNNMAASVN